MSPPLSCSVAALAASLGTRNTLGRTSGFICRMGAGMELEPAPFPVGFYYSGEDTTFCLGVNYYEQRDDLIIFPDILLLLQMSGLHVQQRDYLPGLRDLRYCWLLVFSAVRLVLAPAPPAAASLGLRPLAIMPVALFHCQLADNCPVNR